MHGGKSSKLAASQSLHARTAHLPTDGLLYATVDPALRFGACTALQLALTLHHRSRPSCMQAPL